MLVSKKTLRMENLMTWNYFWNNMNWRNYLHSWDWGSGRVGPKKGKCGSKVGYLDFGMRDNQWKWNNHRSTNSKLLNETLFWWSQTLRDSKLGHGHKQTSPTEPQEKSHILNLAKCRSLASFSYLYAGLPFMKQFENSNLWAYYTDLYVKMFMWYFRQWNLV